MVAALGVADFALEVVLEPAEEGRIAGRIAVVVAQQHRDMVGVRADDRQLLDTFQRQDAVIFQQDNRFLRHPAVQRPMFVTLDDVHRNRVVGAFLGEHPQPEPGLKKFCDRRVNRLVGDKALVIGLPEGAEGEAAV